jgi:formylglycine-generating enzyme required for sulfatase activity
MNTKPERVQKVLAGVDERMACDRTFGGPAFDPEEYPDVPEPLPGPPIVPEQTWKPAPVPSVDGWPMTPEAAKEAQGALSDRRLTIELEGAQPIELVPIPAGKFVMGDTDRDGAGFPDEQPPHVREVEQPFWMATREITNQQYAAFRPDHYSGYFDNLGKNNNRKGRPLNEPGQPVIRISWQEAHEFCRWLSARTGKTVRLPTEAEWEWACRAGSARAMHYGGIDADFSGFENLADKALLEQNVFFHIPPFEKRWPGMKYLVTPFSLNANFNDGETLPTGESSHRPNRWGLHDMHGNVQEWTRSPYVPYEAGARQPGPQDGFMTVRGGSWADRPRDARSAIRRFYPRWQKVWNVGLRVVVETEKGK